MVEFRYQEIFEHGPDTTAYRQLTSDYVSTTTFEGQEIVKVAPDALSLLAREAMDGWARLAPPGQSEHAGKNSRRPGSLENRPFWGAQTAEERKLWGGGCAAGPPGSRPRHSPGL